VTRIAARIALGALIVLFCAAPVPGDIGGCGQSADELDGPIFFATKKKIDCDRCQQCGLETARCGEACDPEGPLQRDFADGCFPLVHDGEACLRALRHAGCDEYAAYVDDAAPAVPSECNFCPLEGGR
jgi:hypothetical protein